ncbi:MAG TPA: RluA family pseudouridine synthase, partial [Planctomycetaceae bacterium]|nr:RluA family pseudouridine synthase [Planctomycetaceae bacterium]
LATSSATDRPGIVHRLDKNTSGLLIIAKSDKAYSELQKMMGQHLVKRTYHAIIWGHPTDNSGTIDLPLGRSKRDRKKMAVATNGRSAITHYQLLERFRSFSYLELQLETGRTHQIRVHLAHLGHPVFGDPEYGGRDKSIRGLFAPERPLAGQLLEMLPRQALHAIRLQFEHPITNEKIELESSLPEDYKRVLDTLRTEGA